MASNDAELRIGGDSSDLVDACTKAEKAVKDSFDRMQASMSSLNGAFQKLQSAFLAVTAVLAGGKAFKEVIGASNDWALESAKLAKALGTTSEQASVMKVALNHIGVESDVLIGASQKMSKQIFSNGAAFETMGIQVKDSAGNYRPVMDVMTETNTKLKAITNPIAQNIAGMQLYGKSWGEVKGVLKLTNQVMDESAERAKQLGLVVTSSGVESAKQYKEQLRDLNLVSTSLSVQMGNQMTPVFVRIGQLMGQEAPAMGKVFATVLESIGFVAMSVWLALKDMGDAIGALAAQGAALLSGDLAAFRAIGKMRDEEAAKNEAAYQRMKDNFGKPLPAAKSSAPDMGGPNPDFGKSSSSKGSADKSRMSAWESQLSEAKVFYQKTYDLREYSKEQEKEYWQSILRNVNVTGQERIAVTKKVSELELEILKKNLQQRHALDAEAINAHEKDAESSLQIDEQAANQEFAMGRISQEQLLTLQQQFEDRRFAIQQEAQAARITAQLGDPNMDPVALQKLLDQMAEIQRAHVLRVGAIQNAAALETKKSQDAMLAPITSAIEKSVTGMIQGTLTLKKALSNLFQSILGEFVSLGAKMVVKWAADHGAMAAVSKAFSAVRQMLFGADAVASVTSDTTAAAGAKVSAAVTIPAEAAEAAGGAAAAVAGIPIVGPALAAAAYAETMAMVMGGLAVASASGGYDIPAGVNPLTQLHENEMVLPAAQADAVRNMASGGGSAGGDVHLHVHTQSTQDFQQFLKRNSHTIAPALRRMARNLTPTGAV